MKKLLPAQSKSPLEPCMNNTEKAKGKIRLWPILILFLLSTFSFTKPIYAAFNTFTWHVTDQNGTPLEGALVWINLKLSTGEWHYVSWCSTDSSGQCSVSLSCAEPCELRGDVEYQSYTGSYSGAYHDGALIEVVISIPASSPTPSPPPYPTPSPYPAPTPTPPPGFACGPSAEERVSRPDACKLWNLTGLYCPSCATSFSVFDEVSWEWRDKDKECEGNVWVTRDWSGKIIIDPSETKIPFVGKKENEDEILYLADYFEGTHDYYKTREYPLRVGPILVGHGASPIFFTNYQGILRKLTPYEYQNQLKREMVRRAQNSQPGQEGSIHDYQLNYLGRLCWDVPLGLDVLAQIIDKIAELKGFKLDLNQATHYCLFEAVPAFDRILIYPIRAILYSWNQSPMGRLFPVSYWYTPGVRDNLSKLVAPPEPDEENYIEKWNAWKESEWGKLWQVAPMVSREDTPGMIIPYLGSKPLDTFEITNPENQVEKVPHVARLYESTQEVQGILMPHYEENLQFVQNKSELILASAKNSQPIIASPAEEKVQGEKILLAQGPGCVPCGYMYYYGDGPSGDDCSCMADIKPDGKPSCRGEPGGAGGCPIRKHWNIYGTICGWDDPKPIERGCNPPDKLCCGGFVNPNPPPEIPACGLPEAWPVDQCEMLAITDSNPNDDLCCEPISIELTAVDMFINENYTECSDYTCGPNGTSLCPDDPCLNKETRDVNREIGINLLHPYLTDIWEQTGLADTAGLFNIFRPEYEAIPKFREIDASSEIMYSQTGFDSIAPSIGKFYFNYLGGVQLAKEWVTRALRPWKE